MPNMMSYIILKKWRYLQHILKFFPNYQFNKPCFGTRSREVLIDVLWIIFEWLHLTIIAILLSTKGRLVILYVWSDLSFWGKDCLPGLCIPR